jgi:hypothetical protein
MIAKRWLVCERTTRWTAALRILLEPHQSSARRGRVLLDEVRTLQECTSRTREISITLVFVEVTTTNVAQVLSWLADISCSMPRCQYIALVDHQFDLFDTVIAEQRANAATSETVAALREAGATDVVLSPRQLKSILPSANCVGQSASSPEFAGPEPGQSVEAWAWNLLPWQDEGRPVG